MTTTSDKTDNIQVYVMPTKFLQYYVSTDSINNSISMTNPYSGEFSNDNADYYDHNDDDYEDMLNDDDNDK